MDAGHGRAHVDHAQADQDRQLGTIAFRQTEQFMKPEAHLGRQEADRPHGAGHHGDHAQAIHHAADPAAHQPLAEHRRQQGTGLQGQAAHVVGMGQHHGGQRAQHRPGQETPVHEGLRQGAGDRLGGAGLGVEGRRRHHEVIDRLASGEEHPAPGQQRAHDDRQPLEGAHLGRVQVADPGAGRRRDHQPHGHQEGQQQQPLEIAAQGPGGPGETGGDAIGDQADVVQRQGDEAQDEADAHAEHDRISQPPDGSGRGTRRVGAGFTHAMCRPGWAALSYRSGE